jgi:hypothetical protein
MKQASLSAAGRRITLRLASRPTLPSKIGRDDATGSYIASARVFSIETLREPRWHELTPEQQDKRLRERS